MAVKIRLARGGRKKLARYRIVVTDSRNPRDGRFIETLGYYNPQAEPKEFKLNPQRVDHWLSTGAEVSQTVANLLKQDNFKDKKEALAKNLDLATLEVQRKPERKRKPKPKTKKEG